MLFRKKSLSDQTTYGIVGLGRFGYALAMAWAYRTMQGVSGDLAGFSLCTGELCGLIALAIV